MLISENFSCQIIRHGSEILISLQGDLDAYTVDQLQSVLENYLSSGDITIAIIDCDWVQYVDSAFLQFLTRLYSQIDSVKVINASKTIRKIFDITGLNKFLAEY